jgi:hypothetical protein
MREEIDPYPGLKTVWCANSGGTATPEDCLGTAPMQGDQLPDGWHWLGSRIGFDQNDREVSSYLPYCPACLSHMTFIG